MASAKQLSIKFPNKNLNKIKAGTTTIGLAEQFKWNMQDVLAVKVGDLVLDLSHPIMVSGTLKLLKFDDPEGKDVFWHSAAHVLAAAIQKVFPKAKNTIGPPIDEGFYYDFHNLKISPEDFSKVQKEVKKIAHQKEPFIRKEISKKEALKLFKDNKFKVEMIKDLDDISIYTTGDFVDLCRGPHIPHTGLIKALKLTKLSGAYWRADSSKEMLTRVYAVAFPTKEALQEYTRKLEEAERRDHRKIGTKLDLFSFHDEGPGFVFWHPNGMIIYNSLVDYWREEHRKAGYQQIMTPVILKKELWQQSGHWDHYRDNMYFTKIDGEDFAIKPMNCPGGILVYKQNKHSYREFPLRLGEIGLDHRHEMSGVLHGLMRVRSFWQDDAHLYCLPEQVEDEIMGVIKLTDKFYKVFGFEYHVELSTRPEKFMGNKKDWDKAEKLLKKALDKLKVKYVINEGDGAFYGPKIDWHIKDCLGRTWQCATCQLDFQMPEKFDLKYMGEDGTENHRPIMLHRTIYGSLERFIGILIEHFAGKLPLWVSPYQIRILTIGEKFDKYAYKLNDQLFKAGIRVAVDDSANTISKKVRTAQMEKVNYMVIVGEKEAKSKTLAIRDRNNKTTYDVKLEKFLKDLQKELDEKTIQ